MDSIFLALLAEVVGAAGTAVTFFNHPLFVIFVPCPGYKVE
jgi:hypothetical protein